MATIIKIEFTVLSLRHTSYVYIKCKQTPELSLQKLQTLTVTVCLTNLKKSTKNLMVSKYLGQCNVFWNRSCILRHNRSCHVVLLTVYWFSYRVVLKKHFLLYYNSKLIFWKASLLTTMTHYLLHVRIDNLYIRL